MEAVLPPPPHPASINAPANAKIVPFMSIPPVGQACLYDTRSILSTSLPKPGSGHPGRRRGPYPARGVEGRAFTPYPFPFSASNTFSDVMGRDVMRTPTASATALAMAPAVGMLAVSPMAMLL